MSPFVSLSISLLVILASICRAAISDKEAVENLEIASVVIVDGDSSILSANGTFKLGFFNNNEQPRWFLGISYASIPTPTYVWVANRENPVKILTSTAGVVIGADGKLAVRDSDGEIVWKTENEEPAAAAKLLEDGNLVLVDTHDSVVWQSFDFPADTWLPGMNLSGEQSLTPWRSSDDPSPGLYSLRLKQSDYSELELVCNGTIAYWSSGNWTGNAFSGVPEMMIQYLYRFHFTNPSSPAASFGYMETATESGIPPLTRFKLESTGQFHQYTWSSQTESWNVFWRAPDNLCKVYGLCGNFGFCTTQLLNPCKCLAGYKPVDDSGWASGDFSRGCQLENESACESNNGFEEIGAVSFDRAIEFPTGSRTSCEKACRSNCSCFGYYLNEKTGKCKALLGSMINLHNLTSDSISEDILYVKVPKGGLTKNKQKKISMAALIGIICGLLSILSLLTFVPLFLYVKKRRMLMMTMKNNEPMINLKVFSYDELNSATGGFSEKLGHGGFGAVFKGELPGSDIEIAVKRLERIGGGEREFRAEVCTVGNIQHVNLVRLIGFCSEKSHRLLVYDYMPNGSLSDYLKRDGRILNWDARFKIATGTAKGLAYLHEGCRDCIIHCDIKPENILLDNDFVPKVSDFGLAKLLGRDFSRVLATMRGTWGYVAPEWISGVAITSKADVYSYGMTLLELLGGRRNVEGPPQSVVGDGDGAGEKWFFPPWAAEKIIEGEMDLVVDFRLGGKYDKEEVRRLGLVAIWCIQDEEATRPSMRDVLKMLEGVVEVGIPPPPKLLQALVSGESFKGVIIDSDGGATPGSPLPSENSPINGRNTF
ncbi:G-type lectin S-receptor-like serine/threonine-protein kinase SD2-2 [Impatiens glandulifera]|uniref:G-type lectin S-receptor-like serine/threonine-protein kinase SD2-2 n=1 Tax=Impatiens glandulifera TaxID=253017 RepID=UPI001FB0CAE5|nr:G-type lectin S-receptor-like serine/threonine-protein kinase SD2-2 [Impatiens glandulifera]